MSGHEEALGQIVDWVRRGALALERIAAAQEKRGEMEARRVAALEAAAKRLARKS